MAVISRSAFATEPTEPFVNQASRLFTFPFWRKFLDYVMPKWFLDSVGFTVLPKGPMDFFRIQTERVIGERATTGTKPADFLQLLLDAQDRDSAAVIDSHRDFDLSNKRVNSRHLTIDEVFAQSVLFFSVGYETSSQVLMYTVYCLARNPDVQEKLATTIESANIGNLDEIQGLPYLDAVISESMRLYNPVLRMERRASEDFMLGGIPIKKGMIIGIPVWALHHSEECFPDPWKFDPDRFLPENRDNIIKSTYLPFGDGPRDCIGRRFAIAEIKVLLAHILPRFRFKICKRTKLQFFTTGRPLLGPMEVIVEVDRRTATFHY